MIMITPLLETTTKPGSATKPFPGVHAGAHSESGEKSGRAAGSRAEAPVARDAARDLQRRPALPRHVLVEVRGHLFCRRRRAD
jgi:hypothetical protein